LIDPALGTLIERNGTPPLWRREPGFRSMVHLILGQQVSLESAAAAMDRLERTAGPAEPTSFLELGGDELRRIGFSRQKAGYVRGMAAGILEGTIDFAAIDRMDDASAERALLAIRGIGPWTAACYLLFCLMRPDAWPTGDRALQVAVGRLDGLPGVPDAGDTDRRAARWTPYRAVAARVLWHEYLGGDDGDRFAGAGR